MERRVQIHLEWSQLDLLLVVALKDKPKIRL